MNAGVLTEHHRAEVREYFSALTIEVAAMRRRLADHDLPQLPAHRRDVPLRATSNNSFLALEHTARQLTTSMRSVVTRTGIVDVTRIEAPTLNSRT